MRQAQGSLRSPQVNREQDQTKKHDQTQHDACELQELGFATDVVASVCGAYRDINRLSYLDPWLRFIPVRAGELRYSGCLCRLSLPELYLVGLHQVNALPLRGWPAISLHFSDAAPRRPDNRSLQGAQPPAAVQ